MNYPLKSGRSGFHARGASTIARGNVSMTKKRILGYRLRADKTAEPVYDHFELGLSFEDNRQVARSTVAGHLHISTAFLVIDHGFLTNGIPILFETMVFEWASEDDLGDPVDKYTQRYSTWEQAVAGHDAVLLQCRDDVFSANLAADQALADI